MIFKPNYLADKITDVSAEFLKQNNINALILDIDNTLVPPNQIYPSEQIVNWANDLMKKNIKLLIASNNSRVRVKLFAEKMNIPFIHRSAKPLPYKIKFVMKKLGINPKTTMLIGDQILTDVLAAKFLNVRMTLVEPISNVEGSMIKLKRKIEKPIKKRLKIILKNNRI